MNTRLMRSRNNKMVAGVCAGLGHSFGIDPVIVRLVMLLLIVAPHSPALLLYLILWVIMPIEPVPTPHDNTTIGQPLN